MAEGGMESLEPEDELDAFNDETFGGDELGDQWEENAHEQLAMMTEEERVGLKQSEAFFNFGSDGEELGGDLEDALDPPPRTNGSASVLTHKMEGLTMTPPSALEDRPIPGTTLPTTFYHHLPLHQLVPHFR